MHLHTRNVNVPHQREPLPPDSDRALPERAQRSGVSSESLRLLGQLHPSVHTQSDICRKQYFNKLINKNNK